VLLFSIYHDDDVQLTQQIKEKEDGLISKHIDQEELSQVIHDVLAEKSSEQDDRQY